MKTITLHLNDTKNPNYATVIDLLTDLGYTRVPMVLEPCEFSVRGDVIDVFASNHSHPIRIEYFGDEIERLNSFNPHSQRSLSQIEKTVIKSAVEKDKRIWISNFSEADDSIMTSFQEDEYIVHENFGVGIFKGLVRLSLNGGEGEYIYIQYKDEDKVYVPLDQFNILHKYSGADSTPKVNGLHDGSWKKTKKKTEKEVKEIAEDIYLLYKIRLMKAGYQFPKDTENQVLMAQSFPHQLTRDQKKAIQDIKSDMEKPMPMDRLICGDVGYGKTEVILRAAFKAIESGKQVAILVPTTILAEQHYTTFARRFEPFGYKIDMLSRFRSKAEQKESLDRLRRGLSHLIIGTHRLLQKDVAFYDLGLLIVDEEQRFGVSHKEKIKQIKQLIDVISVSATPIPRTMYMALSGSKDLSIIETPPKQKKPTITLVSEYTDEKVKQAIKEELKRKGQVFYIWNRVQTINRKAAMLEKLFPKVKIGIAHGQMSEKELHNVMMDFSNGKIKILVCTTIIENGVDITSANTIIIEKAELFGLSQIHQLRGRVGRTSIQGYCYILFDNHQSLKSKSLRRLQAIREYTALGSGYKLALKDLEIRGAGQLLGTQQSGNASTIGFELYCKMLEDAVKIAKGEAIENSHMLSLKPEKILIPEDYIEDPRDRYTWYTRFYKIKEEEEIESVKEELEDRYGPLKKEMKKVLEYVKQQL